MALRKYLKKKDVEISREEESARKEESEMEDSDMEEGSARKEENVVEDLTREEESASAIKKRKVGDDSKHTVGYRAQWEEEYSWLIPERNEAGVVVGMFCRLCKRYRCRNKYNHTVVWSETPCVCIRKDSVRRHSLSLQHKEALEREMCRESSSQASIPKSVAA